MRREEAEIEPYRRSLQWSRRFSGLKVFLNLAALGWNGYVTSIRHQFKMADYLRKLLGDNEWVILNDTALPIVCFGGPGVDVERVVKRVVSAGHAWLSTTVIQGETVPEPVLQIIEHVKSISNVLCTSLIRREPRMGSH